MISIAFLSHFASAGDYVVTYAPAGGARFEIVGSNGLPWERAYSDLYPDDGYDDGEHSANEPNPDFGDVRLR